ERAPAPRASGLLAILGRLHNLLVSILLLAAIASVSLGETASAIIITILVVAGVLIDFFQTYRSQRAADKLREQVTVTATVLRSGTWREIPRPGSSPCRFGSHFCR